MSMLSKGRPDAKKLQTRLVTFMNGLAIENRRLPETEGVKAWESQGLRARDGTQTKPSKRPLGMDKGLLHFSQDWDSAETNQEIARMFGITDF